MLQAARLSLSEARFIAGSWKNARRTGIDAAAEWRANTERDDRISAEGTPSLREAAQRFTAQHIGREKEREARSIPTRSAPGRTWRPPDSRDITRQDVIAGIEAIALGQKARKDSQAACRRGPDGRKATLVFL